MAHQVQFTHREGNYVSLLLFGTGIFIQCGPMDATMMRTGVFFVVLTIMAVAEYYAPRRPLRLGRRRWPANLSIVVLDALIVRLLLPGGAIAAAVWAEAQHIGLFHSLAWRESVAVITSVILLDLAIYAQHVLFHAVPMLWRLHLVHHADCDIDVTTGLRFHPVEILLSMLIKIGLVIALGVPVLAVMIFEIVLNAMAMFNHANVYLPLKLDRCLRLLVVTPDVHRIHHSVLKAETNSNFGFNLSIWDRLFGTWQEQPQYGHDGMVIGLEHLQSAPTQQLGYMLRLPFTRQIGQYPILQRKGGGDE